MKESIYKNYDELSKLRFLSLLVMRGFFARINFLKKVWYKSPLNRDKW